MIAELPNPTPKDMLESRDRNLTSPQLYKARLEQVARLDARGEAQGVSVVAGGAARGLQKSSRPLGVACTGSRRKSKQTPGLGDLWIFAPKGWRLAWWWETKAGRAKLSEAQEDFRDSCLETVVLWGSGDRYDAWRFLIQLGIAYGCPSGSIGLLRRSSSGPGAREFSGKCFL